MNKIKRLFRYDYPVHFILLITNWLPDSIIFLRLRGTLVRPFLGHCGTNLRLGRNLTFYNPSKIQIGKDVYIAQGCWLCAGEIIHIDDEVLIGPYTVIVSTNHSRLGNSYRYGESSDKPIHIGKGSWIAAHCTIIAGANIADGCLIGSNSSMQSITKPNELWAGNPASQRKTFS